MIESEGEIHQCLLPNGTDKADVFEVQLCQQNVEHCDGSTKYSTRVVVLRRIWYTMKKLKEWYQLHIHSNRVNTKRQSTKGRDFIRWKSEGVVTLEMLVEEVIWQN